MTRRELYSVYNLKDKARLLAMTRASLLATAEDLAPITYNMPHSKSAKSYVEELATKILEVDAELDKVREQIREQIIQAEINLSEQIISKVDNPALQKFAILHYVKCLSYKEIAAQMGYTRRNVYFLRRKFLKLFNGTSPCFHPLQRDIVTVRKIHDKDA